MTGRGAVNYRSIGLVVLVLLCSSTTWASSLQPEDNSNIVFLQESLGRIKINPTSNSNAKFNANNNVKNNSPAKSPQNNNNIKTNNNPPNNAKQRNDNSNNNHASNSLSKAVPRFEEVHINAANGIGGRVAIFSLPDAEHIQTDQNAQGHPQSINGANVQTTTTNSEKSKRTQKLPPKYTMGVNKDGHFSIALEDQELLTISDTGRMISNSHLFAPSFISTNIIINGVPQWKLVTSEIVPFGRIPKKYPLTYGIVLACGGYNIVTTRSNYNHVVFSVNDVPTHTQLRITATVHFVDDWQGETAWMKVNGHYMWTASHDQRGTGSKISICGSDVYPDSRFSQSIDVTFINTDFAIRVEFGDNLEEGAEAYFGLSSVTVYSRDYIPY